MILKKKKNVTKMILSTVFVLCMVCSMVFSAAFTASAETSANSAVNQVSDSLVQVRMVYKANSSDSGTPIQGGTGFLINDNTVLTCAHVVEIDDDTKSVCQQLFGSDFDEDNLSCEVVVSGDVTISVQVRKKSQEMDFAILTLGEAMNKRTPAPLGDSDDVQKTQVVYALGFPEAVASMQNKNTYTSDDVTITSGQVSKTSESGGVSYVQHGAVLSAGNSGGPLVNENGGVVAINSGANASEENYYIAISINQIKSILDELGIEYTDQSGSSTAVEEEETTVEQDVTAAAPVVTEAPQQTVAPATEPAEEESTDSTKMIIIIAIAVLAVIIVVVVILIIVNSKKSSRKIAPVSGTNAMRQSQPPRGGSAPYAGSAPYRSAPPAPQYRPTPSSGASATTPGEGSSETTVLNEGAGETSVLGYQPTGASLVRVSSNEKINISKPEFIIGKERRAVDYCVSGNGSISRKHVKITSRGGRCYICDLNSTNGTYVNGTKISPNQDVALNNGDKIKLSDEEFRFMS